MTRRLSACLFGILLLLGCSSSKQIQKRYTPDDQLVVDLIERLKKNPNDADAAKQLPDAYRQAADVRKNINESTYANMSEGDRWVEISKQLLVAQQLYTEIKSNPTLTKLVPDPWNPAIRIQEAKQKAAEEYYAKGQEYLALQTRPNARKAYDNFVKANNAFPNFKDVRDRMEEAKLLSLVKVLVRPVNYYNYAWSYWGYNNDYLQQKMVRDLNSSSYRDTKFYTEADLRSQDIQPDRIVEISFNDLYIGQVYDDKYSINRSKQIKTGETKTNPPQPIFEEIKAVVHVTRRLLQSRASLECRIFDQVSNRNILFDRFPDNYTWTQQSAYSTGDARALDPSDLELINNNGNNQPPPSRNELAQRLINNCYGQLLSRIKSGVNFDN